MTTRPPSSPFHYQRLRPTAVPVLASLAFALAVAGCTLPRGEPDRLRYFTLAPADLAVPPPPMAEGVVVGLRRPELAEYLRGPFEVRPLGGARWAEPLEVALGRTLAAVLGASDGVATVVVYPAPYAPDTAHDLRVTVLRCEGDRQAGQVRFAAVWEWVDREGRRLASGAFEAPAAPWDGADAAVLVEALAAGARALGEQVVATRPR
jgi:uncharacterized lipoprotein YmbA